MDRGKYKLIAERWGMIDSKLMARTDKIVFTLKFLDSYLDSENLEILSKEFREFIKDTKINNLKDYEELFIKFIEKKLNIDISRLEYSIKELGKHYGIFKAVYYNFLRSGGDIKNIKEFIEKKKDLLSKISSSRLFFKPLLGQIF